MKIPSPSSSSSSPQSWPTSRYCCCSSSAADTANANKLDPRVSLFLKRHFKVQWGKNSGNNSCGGGSGSGSGNNYKWRYSTSITAIDREKSKKKFDKIASTRRTPQHIHQADNHWSSCDTLFHNVLQDISNATSTTTTFKSSSSSTSSSSRSVAATTTSGADFWNTSHSLKGLRIKTHSQESQKCTFKPSEFVLLAKLGKGGWGNVYKAVHVPTGHLVALKEILDQESSSVELQDHRTLPLDCGVVPCYGTFMAVADQTKVDDLIFQRNTTAASSSSSSSSSSPQQHVLRTWMILKLCSQGSLGDRLLERGGVLSPREAAHVLKSVSKTITYLHTEHGIVHNDIKATNVLFDEDGSIMVCDLGVARKGLWQTERLGGTYSHMSPEKLTARKLYNGRYLNDEKIDVWALGVMLCEMLFLAHPYPFQALSQCPTVGRRRCPRRNTTGGATSGSNATATTTTPRKIMDLMEETYGTLHLPQNKYATALERNCTRNQYLLLTDLLNQMLNIDFLERIPLANIKKHPWIKQNSYGKWTDRAICQLKKTMMITTAAVPHPHHNHHHHNHNRLNMHNRNNRNHHNKNNNNKKGAAAKVDAVQPHHQQQEQALLNPSAATPVAQKVVSHQVVASQPTHITINTSSRRRLSEFLDDALQNPNHQQAELILGEC